MTLMVILEELEAMMEFGGVASSISANSLILKAGRSGPFSWTKSAPESASFMLEANVSRARVASGASPIAVSAGHAASTYSRNLASALGAGSLATTSKPQARYCAAQLAPITPVPTIAIRRIVLSGDMIGFPFVVNVIRVQGYRHASVDRSSAYAMPVRFPSATSSVFLFDPSRPAL